MRTTKKVEAKYVFDFKDRKAKDALKILAIKAGKSMNDLIEEAIRSRYSIYKK